MVVRVLCSSYWKARNAKSAVSFQSPDIDNVRRGETCDCRCRSASAHRSRPDFMDRFDVSLFAHATVERLSQNILMRQ